MRPVVDRPAIGNADVHRHRGRTRDSVGSSGLFTLAVAAGLAALAVADAALDALVTVAAGLAALSPAAALAALAAVAAKLAALSADAELAALAAVAAGLAALAAVRAAPPTQRKPTLIGFTTSRCATSPRRTPTQQCS